jgi:16S rRNA (guanine527-N7)-methyltransferase
VTIDAAQIHARLLAAGVEHLPTTAGGLFQDYLELLMRWNARLNLTAIRTPEEVIERHFVECAFVAKYLPEQASTLLDFGSGAGFPGIPIAICRPLLRVTLAESQGKKASFLREAVRVLGLSAEVYAGRVQNMPDERLFDVVALRAVEKMPEAVAVAKSRASLSLAIMTTNDETETYSQSFPEFRWAEPVPLPGSVARVLLLGRRPITDPDPRPQRISD